MIPVLVHILMIYKITRKIGHSISQVKIVWAGTDPFRQMPLKYTWATPWIQEQNSSGTGRKTEMKVRIFSRRSHEGMLNIDSLAWKDNLFNACLNKKSYYALVDRHKRLNYWIFVISETCDTCFVNIVVEYITVLQPRNWRLLHRTL